MRQLVFSKRAVVIVLHTYISKLQGIYLSNCFSIPRQLFQKAEKRKCKINYFSTKLLAYNIEFKISNSYVQIYHN